MAEVKFFKSILEDSYETFTAKRGMTIEGIVKEYGDDNVYSENLVECYDVDTGKTFYAPLTDDEDFGVMAVVNGKSVSKEYVLQEDDSVVVMVMPHSGNNGDDKSNKTWSWLGAGLGALVGGLVLGAVGFAAWGTLAAATALPTLQAIGILAGFGTVVGFLAGGFAGALLSNKKNAKNNSKEDSTKLPDIAGSNNQPITGNTIPLVLGKKEVAPFILGSPWIEYTGAGGKDAWLHTLYCVGYGPLSLTDFKFDCLVFSNNARKVFAGKLSGSELNDGDIKIKWDANDIELEIIQQNTNSNVMYYGDIYPYAKKQENVGATPLFIRDKQLTDPEVYNQRSKALIQYMNGTYDNGFRTNSIRFTEQYTRRIEVTLDLPEGAYFERNTDDGEPEKKSIPLWVAIQWRPYSEKAEKAERSKSGTIATRSDGNYAYELSAGNSDGWIPFDYIDVDGTKVAPSNYDRNSDLAAHTGNDLRIDEHDVSEDMSNNQAVESLQKNISVWGVIGKEDVWADNWVESKHANMRANSFEYDGFFINTFTVWFKDGEKKYTWMDEEGDLWVSNEFYEQYKGKDVFAGVTDKFFYSLKEKTEYGKTYHLIHANNIPAGFVFNENLLRECFIHPLVNKPYKTGTRDVEGWISKKSLRLQLNIDSGQGGWSIKNATFVNDGESYDLSGDGRYIYLPNTYDRSIGWTLSDYEYNSKLTTVEINGIKYKQLWCTNWPKKNTHYDSVNYGNENWLNAKAFNLQTVQDDVSSKAEKTNISEIRVTAHANIEEYCKRNNRKPSSWLYSDDNTTKAIEVRVVRLSPNYINEVASDANNKKPKTFHDSLSWQTITSSTIDIKDENNTFNSASEEGLHTVQNKLNGGINLFAIPKYSMIFLKDEGWDIPEENEDKIEVFYGVKKVVEIDGKNHLVYATPVSNEEWLSPSQLDSYIDAYVENDFSEDLKQHIAFHAPYDTDAEIESAQALIGEINFEANRYYFQNSLSGIDKMIYSRPISNKHYKDMCLVALKVKADAAGNIQGQLEKLSVIAQTFAPKLAHNVWFPQNIRKKQRYFYGNKKEIVDTSEKTAKELYEEAVANGDVNAICVNGGNNWRSSMDSIIFGRASSADQGNILIKSGETEAYSGWYLTDGEHNNNSSPSQFMLACVGSHLGKDALGYEDVNQLSVSEWHDKSVNVIDGTCTPEERNAASIFMACNGYVYSKMKFEDLLSKIAFSGRAAFTRDDSGKIVVVMDNKVPYPKGILNNQNALSVSISYSFKPSPSGVMVTFRNEANFGIDEGLMVMNDGENEYNPSNDVETLSLDFVTDIIQAYSLGRYYLATKEFSRDALNWKSGIEGFDLQFGDVVKVNHDMLLVGQSCGRITEILCDEQYAYGLILSDTYEYDGKDDHAIEIMQPGQYGSDKVIVVPVNSHIKTESGSRKAISHTYTGLDGKEHTIKTPRKGLSNLVVFNDKMFIGGTYTLEGKTYFFKPQLDNLVNYGVKDKVSRLYRVKTKTPDTNFTFNYLLVPYDERFYNYGADIPVINRNITVPSRDSDKSIRIDDKASLTDVLSKMEEAKQEAKEEASELIEEAISGITVDKTPPSPVPQITKATCDDKGNITIVFSKSTDTGSGMSHYVVYRKKAEEDWVQAGTVNSYEGEDNKQFKDYLSEKNVNYTYAVTAMDKSFNETEKSDEVTIKAQVTAKPNIPTNVNAVYTKDKISISWDQNESIDPCDNPAKFYVTVSHGDVTKEFKTTSPFVEYNFKRDVDGHPEKTDLSKWSIKVCSESIYKIKSEYTESYTKDFSDYKTWKIPNVTVVTKAGKDSIQFKWNIVSDDFWGYPIYSLTRGSTTINGITDTSFTYSLNRATDGYPEKEEIEQFAFKLKIETEADSKEIDITSINADGYGTWIIPEGALKNENIIKRVNGRNVTLICDLNYNGVEKLYGDIKFKVSIKKGTAQSAELNWFKPNLRDDPYGNEDNYKTLGEPNYVVSTETFQQVLPLEGQSVDEPSDTSYCYKLVAFNEVSECEIDAPIWIIAFPTSARDIALNSISNNKIQEGTIGADRLHASVLSSDSMATYKMTAATATIGKLQDTDMQDKRNYWDLESGAFRVGNDQNYLSFKKGEDGKDTFELKTDFSKINSTLAVWPENTTFTDVPSFEVKPDEENANKGQVTVNAKLNAPYVSIFGHSTKSSSSIAMALGIPEDMWVEGDTKIFIIDSN